MVLLKAIYCNTNPWTPEVTRRALPAFRGFRVRQDAGFGLHRFHSGHLEDACAGLTKLGLLATSLSFFGTCLQVEKRQTPAMLKLHFSPVRCCDISTDERLLLTASDDKSVKLTWLAERRFAATFAGHSNWVRSASLSSSSTHMVSGGDDKTVKLWDVEQKSCLQTFSDSASSITCTRFGLGDHVIIASSWDSCINLWDVRSYGIRQHYGRAHGGSPITQAQNPQERERESVCVCIAWSISEGRTHNSKRKKK